jgi:glycosyltransferase involved in cell wall biosynthesis
MRASLLIITFNQEDFIREALASALNQIYGDLEIIVSDDASTDDTWSIIKSLANKYTGPHIVKLNRNPVNLGIVGNFNIAVGLASGSLIVAQAGDDISRPDRVAKMMDAWLADNCVHDLLYSNFTKFRDGQNKDSEITTPAPLGRWNDKRHGGVVMGAIAAYSRRLFQLYGNVPASARAEDTILSFRANISGGIKYVNEDLLLYRIHPGSASFSIRSDRIKGKINARWNGFLVEAIDRYEMIKTVHPYHLIARCKARRAIVGLRILASVEDISRLKFSFFALYFLLTLRLKSFLILLRYGRQHRLCCTKPVR